MNYREKYLAYLQSDAWRQTRLKVYDRQQGICAMCRKPLNFKYDCHHVHYHNIFTPRDHEACVALHRECHEMLHQKTWQQLKDKFDKL